MITQAGIWNSPSSSRPGVEVEQVVERDLLAAELRDHREQVRARPDLRVVGGALVRVLAVRELEHLLERAHEQRREVLSLLLEPARDRRVVAGRVGERLGGEVLARGRRQAAVELAQLGEHGVVALGARRPARRRRVLGRRADHRRAADVDVLDDLLVGDSALAARCARTDTGSRTPDRRTRRPAPRRRACARGCRGRRAARRRASGAAS